MSRSGRDISGIHPADTRSQTERRAIVELALQALLEERPAKVGEALRDLSNYFSVTGEDQILNWALKDEQFRSRVELCAQFVSLYDGDDKDKVAQELIKLGIDPKNNIAKVQKLAGLVQSKKK